MANNAPVRHLGSTHKSKRRAPASRNAGASGTDTANSLGRQVYDSTDQVQIAGTAQAACTESIDASSLALADDSRGSAFSQIMYPAHHSQTRPPSPIASQTIDECINDPVHPSIATVCRGLAIDESLYRFL